MNHPRILSSALTCVAAAGIVALSSCTIESASQAPDMTGEAPIFEVDPLWPRPLPNHWILGSTIGVGVDSRDHVFIIHRQTTFSEVNEIGATLDPPTSECCVPAPNVLEFDPEGNLVNSWGGPGEGYDWPTSNHGLSVDHHDNIWIGGNGGPDGQLLKFTRDGEFLMQVGVADAQPNSNSTEHFSRVAKISFDGTTDEAFVADGYGNRRVVVLDSNTGEFKRYWGAYGNEPSDDLVPSHTPDGPPQQQFRTPVHCADPSADGLVYVCDRAGNRIQVFQSDGTFVREAFIANATLGGGSVWDITFSRDPGQRFLYVADGMNKVVHVLDRESLEVLTSFGGGGRQPGQFYGVHSVATDSQGNLYTTETYEGKRLQKFVFMGTGPVTAEHQGALWPRGGGE